MARAKTKPKTTATRKKTRTYPVKRKKKARAPKAIFDGLIYQTNYSCAFRLMVYRTNKDMIDGMNVWRLQNDYPYDHNAFYAAVCFSERPAPKIIHDPTGKEWLMYGTMFLNIEDVRSDPFIVIHECLHMTIDRERNVFRFDGVFGDRPDNGNDPEERICYCLQDLCVQTYRKLQDLCPSIFVAMSVNLKS